MSAKQQNLLPKKPAKDEREKLVLIGLVELYLQTGKPVGSHTLKEHGFNHLSPATLRNYFAKLEDSGFLKQQHSSGGRIPTNAAYKLYAESVVSSSELETKEKNSLQKLLLKETRHLLPYLQKSLEILSEASKSAAFLSAPRFDQDFVLDVKLIGIDSHRILCVLITDFGTVHTETLLIERKLSSFDLKRIEQFFHWKITGLDRPLLKGEEEKLALKIYNEVMLRRIVTYSNFSFSDLMKTGFSQMLLYPDFNDASSLASGLSLFENDTSLRELLLQTLQKKDLCFWIGEELSPFSSHATSCSVICIPYFIHQTAVGSIGILCPNRASYKSLFALLKTASELISSSLTQSLYKFKISYRNPDSAQLDFKGQVLLLSEQSNHLLLENKPPQENESFS
jgi:heat-inducible transcriptional repressor